VIMASRPKVSFWQDGSTSPGNDGYPIVYLEHWQTSKEHTDSWYAYGFSNSVRVLLYN
jgi:hypothetical protein